MPVDLVLTGDRDLDDAGTAIAGCLAEELQWPYISCAYQVDCAGHRLGATQVFEDGARRITVDLPAVASVAEDANTPRLPHVADVMNAYTLRSVETWPLGYVGADQQRLAPLIEVRHRGAPDATPGCRYWRARRTTPPRPLAGHLKRRGLI